MKKNVYLILAILGLVIPYSIYFFSLTLHEPFAEIFDFLFANTYSSFFTADLLISVVVFWYFMFNEASKLRMKNQWVYILATVTVGLSFALPLFLYFRESRMESK